MVVNVRWPIAINVSLLVSLAGNRGLILRQIFET